MLDLDFATALEKREHLIALGETDIYLRSDKGFPYSEVTGVSSGGGYRLGVPTGCYLTVEGDGLRFRLLVDFESYAENGTGTSNFDRTGLRSLMARLSEVGRDKLAELLETEVLSGMSKRTNELRAALDRQADSENVVREVIAKARGQ